MVELSYQHLHGLELANIYEALKFSYSNVHKFLYMIF